MPPGSLLMWIQLVSGFSLAGEKTNRSETVLLEDSEQKSPGNHTWQTDVTSCVLDVRVCSWPRPQVVFWKAKPGFCFHLFWFKSVPTRNQPVFTQENSNCSSQDLLSGSPDVQIYSVLPLCELLDFSVLSWQCTLSPLHIAWTCTGFRQDPVLKTVSAIALHPGPSAGAVCLRSMTWPFLCHWRKGSEKSPQTNRVTHALPNCREKQSAKAHVNSCIVARFTPPPQSMQVAYQSTTSPASWRWLLFQSNDVLCSMFGLEYGGWISTQTSAAVHSCTVETNQNLFRKATGVANGGDK